MKIQFNRTGVILYVINYAACVDFYENILNLTKMFETKSLTCFEFGQSYLMVELDEEYKGELKKKERTKTCLRMNIKNVKMMAESLISKNIEVDFQEHSWGIIAKFKDPDGNLCAFKDDEKFEKQIANYKTAE